MYHTDVMGSALDNYITGHYGEDQYKTTCMNECCVEFDDCPCGYDTELCADRVIEDFEVEAWEKEIWDECD